MNKIIAIVAAALALSAPALDDTVTDSDGNVWARQGSLGRNDYVLTNAPGLPKTGGTMTGGLSLGTNELSFAGAVGPGDEYATNLWDRIRVFPAGLGSSVGLASMIWSYVPSAVSSGAWPAVSNRTAELIRSSSVSVDAYTRSETDEKLAAKADEFAEWVTSDPAFGVIFHDGSWWFSSHGEPYGAALSSDPNETRLAYDDDMTATRKRVLRATDAQRDSLYNLESGKIVTGSHGLTVNNDTNGDSDGPVLNIGDEDGTVTYGGVLRVNGVAAYPAGVSESSVVISGASTGYEEGGGIVDIPPSIKIGGREAAVEDDLAVVMQLDGGNGDYEITMDNATLTFDTVKKYAETRNAVIRHGRGTYRVTYVGQNEMMWDCTGIVQGRVLTGMIHMFRTGGVVQIVEPRELVTPEVLSFLATNAYSIAIGSNAVANANRGIAIGFPNAAGIVTEAGGTAVAIGVGAKSTGGSSVAIGPSSQALGANSVQLGSGVNNESATLKFRGWKLVGSDGRIPVERLPAGGADVQADMLDGVYYRRLIYDGSVYYVAVTNMPPMPQEYEIDDPEEVEP